MRSPRETAARTRRALRDRIAVGVYDRNAAEKERDADRGDLLGNLAHDPMSGDWDAQTAKLVAIAEMHHFDRLPPAVRDYLNSAPFGFPAEIAVIYAATRGAEGAVEAMKANEPARRERHYAPYGGAP